MSENFIDLIDNFEQHEEVQRVFIGLDLVSKHINLNIVFKNSEEITVLYNKEAIERYGQSIVKKIKTDITQLIGELR